MKKEYACKVLYYGGTEAVVLKGTITDSIDKAKEYLKSFRLQFSCSGEKTEIWLVSREITDWNTFEEK